MVRSGSPRGMATVSDILSVIEAAYTKAESPDAWLQTVLEALHPHLERGRGLLAHRFTHEPAFQQGAIHTAGDVDDQAQATAAFVEWLRNGDPAWTREILRVAYPRAPIVAWFSELLEGPAQEEQFRAKVAAFLVETGAKWGADSLGLIAGEPSGRGCVFFAPASKTAPLGSQTRALWKRVAAHLVTGYRLVEQRSPEPIEPDAVLQGDGRMVHRSADVTGDQAAALSESARAIDRARGKLRRADPDRALLIWKGLVDGRWSLVDHYDHDGRRYVIAKRNSPGTRPWQTLTAREAQVVAYAAEGQSLKLIGYQLGMAVATVAWNLARAQSKVGARDRFELVAAYRAARSRGP
jgi:DNA-binding CsgD family transcriptional regulator